MTPFRSLRSATATHVAGVTPRRRPPNLLDSLTIRVFTLTGAVFVFALGLVACADHATDRRTWVIHLTPDGKALISKVFAGHEQAMERAMRGLSKSDRATLTGLLKRLGTPAEEQFVQEERMTS